MTEIPEYNYIIICGDKEQYNKIFNFIEKISKYRLLTKEIQLAQFEILYKMKSPLLSLVKKTPILIILNKKLSSDVKIFYDDNIIRELPFKGTFNINIILDQEIIEGTGGPPRMKSIASTRSDSVENLEAEVARMRSKRKDLRDQDGMNNPEEIDPFGGINLGKKM